MSIRDRAARVQRLAGFLAFCALAAGIVVAVSDECPASAHGTQVVTLAPIMSVGRGEPRDLHSPAPPGTRLRHGARACLCQ